MRPSPMDHGDAETEDLFVRYRDTGDEWAFELVYKVFERRLFAIAVRFFRRRHGSEGARAPAIDAVNDTWLRVVECKQQWSGSRGTLSAWIMTIHYHCVLEAARKSLLPESAAWLYGEGRAADPERCILAREALERLAESLSPGEAEVLMAYYLSGGRRLLAAALGISGVALRKRVERLKEALRCDPRFGELIEVFTFRPTTPEEPGG